MLEPVNFLVMDEPTNHLDMRSKEILKQALNEFTGTILLVSHDRGFLDGLVNCVYEFKNQKIIQHLGGIYEFIEKKKIESLKELEQKQTVNDIHIAQSKPKSSDNEISFEEQKEINKQIKRTEKQVAYLESEIEKIENAIAKMDQQLANPQNADEELFTDYQKAKHKLEQTMYEWELSCEEFEEWKNKKTW
jgi:ATP-binding cassette subfamily F protein 3